VRAYEVKRSHSEQAGHKAVFSLSSSLRWELSADAQLNLRADGYEAELRRCSVFQLTKVWTIRKRA